MENLFEKSSKTAAETSGEPLSSSTPIPLELTKDEVVYDETFVVRKTRFDLLKSTSIADSNKDYVTGPNTDQGRQAVVYFTRQHILADKGLATAHNQLESSYDASPVVDL